MAQLHRVKCSRCGASIDESDSRRDATQSLGRCPVCSGGGIRTLTFARWEQRAGIVAAGVGSVWVASIVWYLIAMWSFPTPSPSDAAISVGLLAFIFGPELVRVPRPGAKGAWTDLLV